MKSDEPLAFPLQEWEIQTIQALAYEALDKAGRNEFVRFPDRFRESFEADLQRDALKDRSVRSNVARQADRMGIGVQHPARVNDDEPLDYVIADHEIAARWCRITGLVLTVDTDHEWRELHRELVTRPLMAHRMEREGWQVPEEGLGILGLLESEARHHGLINDEPAPPVDTTTLAERLLATLGAR